MSTNTGIAPAWSTAIADALKLYAGTNTSSPGPTPAAHSAMCKAAVPEPTARQYGTLMVWHHSFSK